MPNAIITRPQAELLYNFCKEHDLDTFMFVKDHGVYFMARNSSKNNLATSEVFYAVGFNPETDDEWYDNALAFGGDDFCDHLPVAWLQHYFADQQFSSKEHFGIKFNPKSISMLVNTLT